MRFSVLGYLFITAILMNVSAQEALTISEDGKIGILNSDPLSELDVNGAINASGDINANGDVITSNLQSPQLDYIYAGSQVLVDHWIGSLTMNNKVYLATAYGKGLLGSPKVPQPSDKYDLLHYISVTGSNNNGNAFAIYINDIAMLSIQTHSTSPYFRKSFTSDFFHSHSQFPVQNVFFYSSPGLNLFIKCPSGNTEGALYGLTLHYVYIRKGVDYSKVSGLENWP